MKKLTKNMKARTRSAACINFGLAAQWEVDL